MSGLVLTTELASLIILTSFPLPRKYFHQGGQKAAGISSEHGWLLSGSSTHGPRGEDRSTCRRAGGRHWECGHPHVWKPHAQNPRCKSHGRLSIYVAFQPLLCLSLFIASSPCVLDGLHFSVYLFPHSFPSCSPLRSLMFMDISLAFGFWQDSSTERR